MIREFRIASAYEQGIASVEGKERLGGSTEGVFFLLSGAITFMRWAANGADPGQHLPFETLSPEEKFAVGLIYDILLEREDMAVAYPRLVEPITILASEVGKLKQAPLARTGLRRRLTEAAMEQISDAIAAAGCIASLIVTDGIPAAFDAKALLRPGILLYRRRREIGDDWAKPRSWLGGRPRLGGEPWPRDRDGRALRFAAQLDLAEIVASCGASDLPDQGMLAFFIGGEGAVIHVPSGSADDWTSPPENLLPLEDAGLGSPGTDGELPRWPVGFMRLPGPSDGGKERQWREQKALIAERFNWPEHGLSVEEAFADQPIPRWWQTAFHLAASLAECRTTIPATIAYEQERLDRLDEQLAGLQGLDPNILEVLQTERQRRLDEIETI